MRYRLIGKKIPHVGKPLWEILANLKNFGVGRMVLRSILQHFPEPSFMRILKVQPLPAPTEQFRDRAVIVWVEDVYKGKKKEEIICRGTNFLPDFILVPKLEEEKYLKRQEEFSKTFKMKVIPKYREWPPLYKLLWERWNLEEGKKIENMPKLKTVINITHESRAVTGESDEIHPPLTSKLYRLNTSVDSMIREIVQLQKKINAHS